MMYPKSHHGLINKKAMVQNLSVYPWLEFFIC